MVHSLLTQIETRHIMERGQNKRGNHIKRAFTIVELVIVMAIITVPIVSDNYELTQDIIDLTLGL